MLSPGWNVVFEDDEQKNDTKSISNITLNYRKWAFLVILFFCSFQFTYSQSQESTKEIKQMYLERLLSFFNEDDGVGGNPRAIKVSPLDPDWTSWQKRTGELPPDFSTMPTIWQMPDPLVINEGSENIPVKNMGQWLQHREYLKQQVKYWLTGTFPPKPENLKAEILSETYQNGITQRMVRLAFGPDGKASLELELLIPSGKGPFPVFLTQHNHAAWGHIAVRRGYIACIYAGSDSKDDADEWADIYYPEYDFSLLMRRAWGAHRAVDYLFTLDNVDKDKIAIAGHSRNGKQSLMAAAFDERITACIPSSAGTGGELSFRHAREEYSVETIKVLTGQTTAWFHPRLRFFVGNEYKLPVDQNTLMALVAPRHLMLSTAFTEPYGNPWGAEQMYHSTKKVYQFLGAEDNLAIRMRLGGHSTLPFIIEEYLDFFDYAFGRNRFEPPRDLLWNYNFSDWVNLSGENINPLDYPEASSRELLLNRENEQVSSVAEWVKERASIIENIRWSLGEAPEKVAHASTKGSFELSDLNDEMDYLDKMITRTDRNSEMGRSVLPGIGEKGHGFLYYPQKKIGKGEKVPLLLYLHDYSFSSGFTPTWPFTSAFSIEDVVQKGIAVLAFDQIGMGSRIQEGSRFYQRHPHWSKMGKMVSDVMDAVTACQHLEIIDTENIYTAGFALGGTVGLYAAALDTRIKGVAAFGAFTPLRLSKKEKELPGIREYAYLHGLQPRLGFFVGHEERLPIDFHEIISSIAPRKVLLVAPRFDQDADIASIEQYVSFIRKVFAIYDQQDAIDFQKPEYYNQFTKNQFNLLLDWLGSHDK